MEDNRNERVLGLLLVLAIVLLSVAFCGCHGAEKAIPTTSARDTVWRYVHSRDTLVMKDSVEKFVVQKGDTVHVKEVVTRWRERVSVRRDTLWRMRTDSIKVPYKVTERVEVAKPQAWWRKGLQWAGALAVVAVIVAVAVKLRR